MNLFEALKTLNEEKSKYYSYKGRVSIGGTPLGIYTLTTMARSEKEAIRNFKVRVLKANDIDVYKINDVKLEADILGPGDDDSVILNRTDFIEMDGFTKEKDGLTLTVVNQPAKVVDNGKAILLNIKLEVSGDAEDYDAYNRNIVEFWKWFFPNSSLTLKIPESGYIDRTFKVYLFGVSSDRAIDLNKFLEENIFKDVVSISPMPNKEEIELLMSESEKKPVSLSRLASEIKTALVDYYKEQASEFSKNITGFDYDDYLDSTLDFLHVDYDVDEKSISIHDEVNYEELEKLCDIGDSVIKKYNSSAYFEPVDAGLATAYFWEPVTEEVRVPTISTQPEEVISAIAKDLGEYVDSYNETDDLPVESSTVEYKKDEGCFLVNVKFVGNIDNPGYLADEVRFNCLDAALSNHDNMTFHTEAAEIVNYDDKGVTVQVWVTTKPIK